LGTGRVGTATAIGITLRLANLRASFSGCATIRGAVAPVLAFGGLANAVAAFGAGAAAARQIGHRTPAVAGFFGNRLPFQTAAASHSVPIADVTFLDAVITSIGWLAGSITTSHGCG